MGLEKKTAWEILLVLLGFGLLIAAISALVTRYIAFDGMPLADYLHAHRDSSGIIYFCYIVVASIIVPLPTLPADVVFLEIFNPWKVFALRLVADLVGGGISFYLARIYGHKLLERWFSAKSFAHIKRVSESVSWKQFFWITMFPLINTELMAYAGGLSQLSLLTTLAILFVGVAYRLGIVYIFINFK